MKFSFSTGTLYVYPLRWILRWAKEAGFDGVELVINPEAIVRGGRAVRDMAEGERLDLLSVHPTVVPLPGWQERRGGLEPTIRLAQEAGVATVVMHTPRAESLEVGEGLAFQQRIEAWQTRLAGSGLRLAMENKAIRAEIDKRYALTPLDRLRAFADRHDLDLVLDTTHAGTAKEDLLQAMRLFNGRLVNVHLSDMGGGIPLSNIPSADTWLGQHRFPGDGDLALADLLAGLAQEEYAGPVTLEMTPFAGRVWWPPAIRRRLAQALRWMKGAAKSGGATNVKQ